MNSNLIIIYEITYWSGDTHNSIIALKIIVTHIYIITELFVSKKNVQLYKYFLFT